MHRIVLSGAAVAVVGLAAAIAVSVVFAGGGTLTGGGSSNWDITNTGGTDNGLPAGGSCESDPGFTVEDADIPAGSDAYDNGQMIWVDGSVFAAPGPVSPSGQTITAGPVSLSGLDVTMEYYAASGTATARTFVTFTNPSGSPVNASVDFVTNMGSDGSTVVDGSSSGDTSFTAADRWVITSDGSPSDPVITHVLWGPGSPAVMPSAVSQTVFSCAGTEGILATFDISVPAGVTRSLLFFNQMNADVAGAMSGTTDFDTNPPVSGDLLSSLSTTQLGEVLNWNFGITPPTATPVAPPAPTATPEASATVFTGDIEIVDASCGDGTIALTVNPESTGITTVVVEEFMVSGSPNDLTLEFDPPVAINPDGSFSNTAPLPPPLDVINASLVGTFDFAADPATVAGTITIGLVADPSTVLCEADYTAEALAVGVVPPTATPVAVALPQTGTGAGTSDTAGSGWLIAVLAGAALVAGLGYLALHLRRRSA